MFKVNSGSHFIDFEHISHFFLVLLLLTLNKEMFAGITSNNLWFMLLIGVLFFKIFMKHKRESRKKNFVLTYASDFSKNFMVNLCVCF